MNNQPLKYNVVNKELDLNKKHLNLLETILKYYEIENIKDFISPKFSNTHDPFKLKNMQQAIELLFNSLDKKILMEQDEKTWTVKCLKDCRCKSLPLGRTSDHRRGKLVQVLHNSAF